MHFPPFHLAFILGEKAFVRNAPEANCQRVAAGVPIEAESEAGQKTKSLPREEVRQAS
jgi:hypothetical protein